MPLHEWLARGADRHPDRDAVLQLDGRSSYGRLAADAGRIANVLGECGVKRGDRVVLALDNSYLWVAAFFGILRAGAVVVPLPAGGKNNRLAFAVRDCAPVACVVSDTTADAIREAPQQPGKTLVVYQPDTWADRTRTPQATIDLLRSMQQAGGPTRGPRVADTDLAAIIYTSGSTGKPRGVMLSHSNLAANAESIVQYLGLSGSDRVMVVLPFHYVYGLSLLTTHVSVGGSLAIDNRFAFPNAVLHSMQQFEVTGFAGVPSTFALLLHRSSIRRFVCPSLRYVTQAGGPMAPALLRQWLEAMPRVPFYVMYGATEAAARLAYLEPSELPARIGSIGKAIPNVELDVIGDDGERVRPGEVGEIVARGPNIMVGYWNAADETRVAFGPHGYRTGDLARVDADGFLYIVGRREDMLKIGAERVGAREIEDVLQEHAAVHEVAVVGTPHDLLGEAPVAFVALRPGESATAEELRSFCRTRLADAKVPLRVVIQAEIPKSAAGKVDRPALRLALAEIGAPL